MNKDIEEYKKFERRIFILGFGKAFLTTLLIGKLYHLQILNKSKFGKLSETNRVKIKLIYPERGIIFDKIGNEIASNRIDYQISFLKEEKNEIEKNIKKLKKIISISDDELVQFKKSLKREKLGNFVVVKKNLNWNQLETFEYFSYMFPYFDITKEKVRSYKDNYAFSHVIGYVGFSNNSKKKRKSLDLKVGRTGIEKVYDSVLLGKQGWQKVESNSTGRIVRKLENLDSIPGQNLKTNIISEIQKYSYQMLKEKSGSLVLMDCISGGVLSMVSTPSFDINEFSYGVKGETWRKIQADKRNPLLNKSISGLYAPGSTFKLIVSLFILQNKEFKASQKIYCSGSVELGNHKFHCWKRKGHGYVDLNTAIKESCDCYFYSLANEIDIDLLAKFAYQFGIGTSTKVDLPNELNGLMPNQEWKRKNKNDSWHLGETYNAVIGQGFTLSTPLQIAVMTARIASGKKISPKILVNKKFSEHDFQDLNVNSVSLDFVRKSMFEVVNEYKGTAFSSKLKSKKYKMAGKTGTSQVRRISLSERESGVLENKELPYQLRDHSIFAGFAPFDNPRLAICVVMEHEGSGSKVAAPISRDVLDFSLKFLRK